MLLASSGVSGASSKTYIDDYFSVQLRTGTGSTTSIITGFQPDLIWTKSRSATTGHRLVDSTRGAGNSLESNSTLQQQSEATGITAFSSSGYSIGTDSDYNTSGAAYVDWCWKKAPKFFDVVTYTGNGTTQSIAHSLGQTPGMVVIKNCTTGSTNWPTWHRGCTQDYFVFLNLTNAEGNWAGIPSRFFGDNTNTVNPTSTQFTVGLNGQVNDSGATYVAYLFAHDPSADGIIQCGSFTGNTTVNIGWEPQWIMIKRTDAAGDWIVIDSMRGCSVGGVDAVLNPNLSNAESVSNDYIDFTATGFITKNLTGTYIYTVIRRPNKPPTSGTQVYNAIARTGTGAAATVTGVGFAPDFAQISGRPSFSGKNWVQLTRLCGGDRGLSSDNAGSESTNSAVVLSDTFSTSMDGVRIQTANPVNSASYTYINHFFRRAPGFMDVVCYTGTGVARTVPHNLGAVPELMIVKNRGGAANWVVYCSGTGNTNATRLNSDIAAYDVTLWNSNTPTASSFSVGNSSEVNASTNTYVAYLFATLAGISKVGSYTGNGSSQTINCGFSAGARFILVKRTDAAGDWYVWSSATGIVAANDPHLSLNTTAAEVTTDDSVDPDNSGFVVLQNAATNINVNGASYIYLSIS